LIQDDLRFSFGSVIAKDLLAVMLDAAWGNHEDSDLVCSAKDFSNGLHVRCHGADVVTEVSHVEQVGHDLTNSQRLGVLLEDARCHVASKCQSSRVKDFGLEHEDAPEVSFFAPIFKYFVALLIVLLNASFLI
jgi:hypothetical protein